MEYLSDRALIALQGPHAMSVLQALIPQSVDLTKMPFMTTTETIVSGLPCLVTRCGYTGEDGFEVSVANTSAISLWQTFLKDKRVLAAGLGVRDSLRLEAGLCLYGHELNETITPVEAGLLWTIGKRRREEGGFLGAAKIQEQIKNGATKKLCGLIVNGGAPAREGSDILDAAGNKIGVVTSGVPAPSLDMKKIAMGYIDMPHNKVGTQLTVSVRGKVNPAEVVKMPFVPSQYYRLP